MDKTQTEALIKWSTTMVESIEEINDGLNTLKELVFKHAQVNLDSRKQLSALIIQLAEKTNVISEEEVKQLKEI
jgi:hypothetical protein|tara:strand:+ start:1237 stop:1458 length:222 start_codon:yes stop_codon:yes gene_type:complete